MKEKKEIEVATNVSSGAEKVETVKKQVKTKTASPKRASVKSQEKIDVKKMNAASTDGTSAPSYANAR